MTLPVPVGASGKLKYLDTMYERIIWNFDVKLTYYTNMSTKENEEINTPEWEAKLFFSLLN